MATEVTAASSNTALMKICTTAVQKYKLKDDFCSWPYRWEQLLGEGDLCKTLAWKKIIISMPFTAVLHSHFQILEPPCSKLQGVPGKETSAGLCTSILSSELRNPLPCSDLAALERHHLLPCTWQRNDELSHFWHQVTDSTPTANKLQI